MKFVRGFFFCRDWQLRYHQERLIIVIWQATANLNFSLSSDLHELANRSRWIKFASMKIRSSFIRTLFELVQEWHLIEGVAVMLERVMELKKQLPHFNTRAAVIGYSNESVADEIIKYSNEDHDHLWRDMQDTGKGEAYVREMVRNQLPLNEKVEALVRQYGDGFAYFDRSVRNFDEHTKAIVDYYRDR